MSLYCWTAAIICLVGTVINIKRINLCFVLWAIGEVMWTIYDLRNSLHSRAILDIVGFILAIVGIWVHIAKPRFDRMFEKKFHEHLGEELPKWLVFGSRLVEAIGPSRNERRQ